MRSTDFDMSLEGKSRTCKRKSGAAYRKEKKAQIDEERNIWRNERSPEFIKITSLHILNVLEFILLEMFEKYFFLIFSLFVYQ